MVLALQLYTVRDQTAQDFAGTLRRVAELGYPAVEFAGYGGLSIEAMNELLAETSLQALSSHVSLDRLNEQWDQELAYCKAIGCSYLIVPWLAPELRNRAGIKRVVDLLNRRGPDAQAEGITLGYHNHDFEFQPLSEQESHFLLDYLVAETDPSTVALELDTYWAAYASVDPIAYLQNKRGRIKLVHLKDMAATPERSFTEVGQGTLPITGIVQAAQETGVQGYIVENDQPRIPSLESAARSLGFLRPLAL